MRDSSKKAETSSNLWSLPEELRVAIIRLACSPPPADEDDIDESSPASNSSNDWRFNLNLKTICDLCLVSKRFYSMFNPILWAHIRITHPSALIQLHAALLSRPSNGLLVTSLHLGPLDDLDEDFWPFLTLDPPALVYPPDDGKPKLFFKTGLTEKEEYMRPWWCRAGHGFAYLESTSLHAEGAVKVAIHGAMKAIGVNPQPSPHFCDEEKKFIGIIEWTRRVFDVQGALDLYLHRMGQLDDAAWPKNRGQEDYPRLVVQGSDNRHQVSQSNESMNDTDIKSNDQAIDSEPAASSSSNTFVVTRDQIRAHLARPGALLDHFDHPLIFAREGVRDLAVNQWGEVVVNPASISDSSYAPVAPPKNWFDRFRPWSDGPPALGRSVLEHTPHVRNLSLTGVLYQVLSDDRPRPPLPLPELTALSIGPLTPWNRAAGCLWRGMSFPALEKLRVCGANPGNAPARLVAGEMEGLPNLKEVHWDCGHTDARYNSGETTVCEHFNIMRGAGRTAKPESDTTAKGSSSPDLYIEARLHPQYAAALLNTASTPQIRNALMEGLPADDALHRLRVVESRAAKTVSAPSLDFALEKYDVLREEGQQWWRQSALEVERRERQGVAS